MRVTMIAFTCEGGNCPTTYATDRGSVLVQGYVVDGQQLVEAGLGAGSPSVEVPAELLAEHARLQGAQRWIASAIPTDRGTVIVSGAAVSAREALPAGITLPQSESLIELYGEVAA